MLTTVYPTQDKKDATRVARELGSYYDRVVCCGGDGTLHEVVTGLMALERRPEVGYIPAGTTNDFSRNLKLPKGYDALAATASEASPARWTSAGSTTATLSMWPPSAPSPRWPTTPPRT